MLIRQAVCQRQRRGRRQRESHGHGRGAAGACDLPPGLRPPPPAQGATATWRLSHHYRSHRAAVTVSATSKMCPGNWLWASMTFMARFSRSSSRSPVRTRGPLEEMPTVQHPFLNVFELERLLYTGKTACNHADEVWPGLYLGDQDIANNHRELRRLGITHVLNASHSRWRGTPEAYEGLGIRYLGVEAHDSPAFDMSIHFQTAADFIHRALGQPGGKILVHCAVGVSRSATLVLAYLMLYHRLTLVEAIKKVKDHRGIIPNRGFLRQLLALDRRLRQGLEA
ncbi:dual specificity protein phosphatase 26 [Sturnira hondurensis]|uniref:dual specificity protein phosphatase 26 n=1 Tax=Sturnira hondurensis TaxID=192404 RepID=UPI00187AAC13|nr:dual specificity protein phosphatase 26 [Sturnira hondurensis]